MATITDYLLKELSNAKDIQTFFNENEDKFIKETPLSFLNYIINTKNMTVAQVAKTSGSTEYVYKVFNGTRKPSRNIIIAIAFGAELSFEETQLLLRISKQAILDSRDKRDSIIIYGLVHHLSIYEVDDLLFKNDLVTIKKHN